MKWKKPKESKSLQEKAAYGKIKKAEKITKWTNVAYPDRDGAELEKEWEKKKTRMFAKFCWETLEQKHLVVDCGKMYLKRKQVLI